MHRAILPPDPERRVVPPDDELTGPLRVGDLLAPRQVDLVERLDRERIPHPVREPDHSLVVDVVLHLDDDAEAALRQRFAGAGLD